MKKIIVNGIKLHCSKGRIEKGETVTLPDEEIAKINKMRPHLITVVEDVVEKPAKAAKKRKRARNDNGTLKSDDPSTPNVNEAWE